MKISDQGIINRGKPNTPRAFSTFSELTPLADGSLLVTCRVDCSKDSADGTVELKRSDDGGQSWSTPETPSILPDGRVILAWVDRFQSHSIRARLAPAADAPFDATTEVELYRQTAELSQSAIERKNLWLNPKAKHSASFTKPNPNISIVARSSAVAEWAARSMMSISECRTTPGPGRTRLL